MGKKPRGGSALRSKKRALAAGRELVETAASEAETGRIVNATDDDLFAIDTDGADVRHMMPSSRKKRKYCDDDGGKGLKKKKKKGLSEKDERVVRGMIERHGELGVQMLAKMGRDRVAMRKKAKNRRAGTTFDLWGEEDDEEGGGGEGGEGNVNVNVKGGKGGTKVKNTVRAVPVGRPAMAGTAPVSVVPVARPLNGALPDAPPAPSKRLRKIRDAARANARPSVAVEVAGQGQSYRPDPVSHQDAVGEALAVELRREEAERYKKEPISRGMSDETKALLVGDSDGEGESDSDSDDSDDDDDSDAEDGEGGGATGGGPRKKKEKITRAQKNKRRRVKAERVALEKRREERRLLASVERAKSMTKDLAKKEREDADKRSLVAKLKAEAKAVPLGTNLHRTLSELNPVTAPSVPVALTEELQSQGGGRLRTVRPKGSLLKDRMESMGARGLTNRRALTKKKGSAGKRRTGRMEGEFL